MARNDLNNWIGYYLYQYRLEKRITQSEVAIMIMASQSQVSRWERKINIPSKLRLEEIIRILKDG